MRRPIRPAAGPGGRAPLRAAFGRGAAWKLAADLLGRLLQYALLWLAARRLGQADFGDLAFALSAGYTLAQVSDFGLQLFVQRELARLVDGTGAPATGRDAAAAGRLVGGGLAIKAWLAGPTLAALAALVLLEPVAHKPALLAVGAAMIAGSALEYCAYCFRALGRLQDEAAAILVARGGNLLLGAGLLLLGGGVVGLAVAANAAMLAGTAFAYRRLRAAVAPIWRPDWAYWRRQAAQQLPIGLGILCSMLAFRVDMLLIPAVAGRAALGVYSVAYKLFEPALIVPGVVLAATFPLLARRGAGGADAAGAVLAPTLGLLGGLGAAAAAGLALLAGPIVGLLYGAPYAAAAPVLAALAPALLPLFLNYGLTHALIALDRTRAYAALMFAALVANLALNLALLPALGILGAALATGATEVVVLAGCVLALGRGARRAVAAPAAEPGWEAGL